MYRFALRCVTALLLTTGLAGAQVIDEYSGQETYMRFCASCHGESGTGDGPVAKGLPISVPDLTRLEQRWSGEFDANLMRKIIDGREIVVIHGTRYMPVWGYEFWIEEGADEEAKERVYTIVDNLVDYIRSIQK